MSTRVARTIAEVREAVREARGRGLSIGCVPTMGALHAGHGALVRRAAAGSDFVVVTLFVNPTQFDRRDDYERYARTLEADVALCSAEGADVVFAPAVEEMYPGGEATVVDVPELARHLCGAHRPGHFRGVATVVAKLLLIVLPDAAYFGEKDAQQLALIQQMARDLNFPVEIVPVPTVREADGLAMSSRNERLSAAERAVAPQLYRALQAGAAAIAAGERDPGRVRAAVEAVLAGTPELRAEYIEIVDGRMQPVGEITGPVRIATAAWLGGTRLIDNVGA